MPSYTPRIVPTATIERPENIQMISKKMGLSNIVQKFVLTARRQGIRGIEDGA